MTRLAFVTIALSILRSTSGNSIRSDWNHKTNHAAVRSHTDEHHPITRKMVVGSFVFNQTLWGHTKAVNSVAFNHDGSRLASGSKDHTIKIWDMDYGGELLHTLVGHDGSVYSVAYNHDGSRIASGCGDQYIKIWNVKDGDVQTLKGHSNAINSVAYNHDGSRLVSGSSDTTIKIWDMNNGGTLLHTLTGHDEDVSSVAYNHDGSRIVSGSEDETIKIWNDEGTLLHTLRSHTDWINSVAYNYDGTRVVSAAYDKTIKVWNMEKDSAALINSYKDTSIVESIAFNHDGSNLVSGSYDEMVKTWNVHEVLEGQQSLKQRQILEGHTDAVYSVAYNHDGSRMVSGSADQTIIIWTVCPPGTVPEVRECVINDDLYAEQTQVITPKSKPSGAPLLDLSYSPNAAPTGTQTVSLDSTKEPKIPVPTNTNNSTITTEGSDGHITIKNSTLTITTAEVVGAAFGVLFFLLWVFGFFRCFKCCGSKHGKEYEMINAQPENVIT